MVDGIEVFWSEKHKQFIAYGPDLPGCFGMGDNAMEAVRDLQDACAQWIEVMQERPNSVSFH